MQVKHLHTINQKCNIKEPNTTVANWQSDQFRRGMQGELAFKYGSVYTVNASIASATGDLSLKSANNIAMKYLKPKTMRWLSR